MSTYDTAVREHSHVQLEHLWHSIQRAPPCSAGALMTQQSESTTMFSWSTYDTAFREHPHVQLEHLWHSIQRAPPCSADQLITDFKAQRGHMSSQTDKHSQKLSHQHMTDNDLPPHYQYMAITAHTWFVFIYNSSIDTWVQVCNRCSFIPMSPHCLIRRS